MSDSLMEIARDMIKYSEYYLTQIESFPATFDMVVKQPTQQELTDPDPDVTAYAAMCMIWIPYMDQSAEICEILSDYLLSNNHELAVTCDAENSQWTFHFVIA